VLRAGAPKQGDMLDDLWQLDLSDTPTWHALSPSGRKPGRRCSHTAVAVGSEIIFHGGAGAAPLHPVISEGNAGILILYQLLGQLVVTESWLIPTSTLWFQFIDRYLH
jgi:Galactose oxidase, central domain